MKTGKARNEYKANDDYYTPKWIFEKLGLIFDLDVCAPEKGVPWLPTLSHYCKEQDGLKQDWFGLVWMNPPFSNQRPWIEKFIQHQNGLALLPWYRSLSLTSMWNTVDAVTMLPPNLKFEHKTEGTKSIFSSCGLFAFGLEATEALKRLDNRVRL